MFKVVDVYGDILEVDLEWLEEEIRKGHLSPHTGVCHEAWTGDAFKAAGELPALAEVWKEPNAAFTKHIFRTRPAWLSHSLSATVFVCGILQFMGLLPAWLGATGFEPVLFDGAWWSPFGAQLVHAGPDHLLMNLAVLGYCGYRVERALGAVGYLAVVCAAVLGGALAVTLFEDLGVIGSSVIGYGVWGAQIAIGFRFGESIPPHFRKFYGYGNLLAFAVLYAGSFTSADISHWGHAGGLLGGVAIAMAVRTAPQHGPRASLLAAFFATVLALALGPLLRLVPPLAYGPAESVELDEAAISLEIPGRLMPQDERIYAYTMMSEPAWKTGYLAPEALYAGSWKMPDEAFTAGDLLLGEDFLAYVTEVYGLDAVLVEDPEPLMPGWTATAVEFVDADNGRTYRIEEHHFVRGLWLTRLGLVVALDGPGHRRALFEDIVRTAEETELAEVTDARKDYERNPGGRLIRLNYANTLAVAGEYERARELYEELIADRDAAYGWDALYNLTWYQARVPHHFPVDCDAAFALQPELLAAGAKHTLRLLDEAVDANCPN